MEDRGLWGRELQRVSNQVRTWPRYLQRSAAIRDWNPLTNGSPRDSTPRTERQNGRRTVR